METSQLKMGYHVDSKSFSTKIILSGADPSHTKDLIFIGGVFHQFITDTTNRQGWVFNISQESVLRDYIKDGRIPQFQKLNNTNAINAFSDNRKSNIGSCKDCGSRTTLDTAIKSYIQYYTGGLPKHLTTELLQKEYTQRFGIQLCRGTFVCTRCKERS